MVGPPPFPKGDRRADYGRRMTMQIPDSVFYRGQTYDLTGQEGDGLFTPSALGLEPLWMSTGCYRGYMCEYKVVDGELVLTGLAVRVEGGRPALFGVEPVEGIYGHCHYEGLNEPIRFTGRMLLGDDFHRDLYVHMGYPSAWKFDEVHELTFENGRLTAERDRSEDAEQRRAHPKPGDVPPPREDREATEAWIERIFQLGFDL